MLIWACTVIRMQPFDQQFFCPLKSRCLQSKKLKTKLMKSQKNEANFADSQWFCSFFLFRSPHGVFVFTICCVPFLTFPHYTIIPSYAIINFLRFFHPILLSVFVDLSTLYHYFALYYYLGLQSTIEYAGCTYKH